MVGNELLLQSFAGERVIIFTTAKVVTQEGESVVETNINIEGLLIDADKDFVYLGKDALSVESAVAKSQIILIERADDNAMLEALIDKPKRGDMN